MPIYVPLQYMPLSYFLQPVPVLAGIALVHLSAAAALFRFPRIAGQRRWRQMLALIPLCCGLALVVTCLIFLYEYQVLSHDATYTLQAVMCANPGLGHFPDCSGWTPIDAAARQALEFYFAITGYWVMLSIGFGSWALAVLYFLVLASGRRRSSPVHVPTSVVSE